MIPRVPHFAAAVVLLGATFGTGHAAPPPGVTILGAPPPFAAAADAGKPGARATALPKPFYDADVAGREPFQATLQLNISGSTIAAVTIPAGKRLIVDEVNIAGAASSSSGSIQPIVLAYVNQTANGETDFYYSVAQSTLVSSQFYSDFPVKLYADSLSFGLGFAGYSPSYLGMIIHVSGHLIATTAP